MPSPRRPAPHRTSPLRVTLGLSAGRGNVRRYNNPRLNLVGRTTLDNSWRDVESFRYCPAEHAGSWESAVRRLAAVGAEGLMFGPSAASADEETAPAPQSFALR
jgi:hypothetical protein